MPTPAVPVGAMASRVTIQQKTRVADSQGGGATTWAALGVVWAAVEPVRTSERLQAGMLGSQLDYRVTLHYRADVTPAMRVLWTPSGATAPHTLEIRSVRLDVGPPQRLVLDCSEVR
jgi:SPP1 family predicted phage head-tail adaptor